MSQAVDRKDAPWVRPLRVGLVAGAGTLARLGPAVRHLVVGLLDEPMHVTMVLPDSAGTPDVPSPPVQIIRYLPARLSFFRNRLIDSLAEAMSGAGVGLLHALDGEALGLVRGLSPRMEVSYLVSVLGPRQELPVGDARCRGVLAASEPILQAIRDSGDVGPETLRLLRPAIHQAHKAACFIDPTHTPAVVAAGPFDQVPPFAAVLEAMAALREERRGCVFFVVGSGPAEAPLRRQAQKLRLMDELTFVDRRASEPIGDILKAADLFISPVPSQEVEIELLSAMAAGVPVVTAGSEASDFVIPDRTALTFPTGQAAPLAAALRRLLDDRAAARNLAENALDHLRDHHSPARMAGRLAEMYRGAVRGLPLPE